MFARPICFPRRTIPHILGSRLEHLVLDLTQFYSDSSLSQKNIVIGQRLMHLSMYKIEERRCVTFFNDNRCMFELALLAELWKIMRTRLGLTDNFINIMVHYHGCDRLKDEFERKNLIEKHGKLTSDLKDVVKKMDKIYNDSLILELLEEEDAGLYWDQKEEFNYKQKKEEEKERLAPTASYIGSKGEKEEFPQRYLSEDIDELLDKLVFPKLEDIGRAKDAFMWAKDEKREKMRNLPFGDEGMREMFKKELQDDVEIRPRGGKKRSLKAIDDTPSSASSSTAME